MVENCEDCHVLTERIKNLAHWIMQGEALSTLLPSDKKLVSLEILKLVQPLPAILGCDRCATATIEDFDGWKIPQEGDFDDVTLCLNCQKKN
jgi:hypothetical protein